MNWIDYIIIALVLLMTFWGYRRGLLSSVFGIAKYIIGVPVSCFVSNRYYEEVYQNFVYDRALTEVNERIAGASGTDTFLASVRTAVEKLPSGLQQRIDLSALAKADENTVAELIMKETVQPIAYLVLKILLFLATFIIIALICSALSATIKKRTKKHPVLTKTNSLLGGFLGLVRSLLLVLLIAAAVSALESYALLPKDSEASRLLADSVLLEFVQPLLPIEFQL